MIVFDDFSWSDWIKGPNCLKPSGTLHDQNYVEALTVTFTPADVGDYYIIGYANSDGLWIKTRD